jgi:hypothetical protein
MPIDNNKTCEGADMRICKRGLGAHAKVELLLPYFLYPTSKRNVRMVTSRDLARALLALGMEKMLQEATRTFESFSSLLGVICRITNVI